MNLRFNPQPKPQKTGPKPRKPIPGKSKKRMAYLRSHEGKTGQQYMAGVRTLPCCTCGSRHNVEAHHCFHGRYGQRKASDFETIPLCANCHRLSPFSIHQDKANWAERYGPDWGFIPQTRAMLSYLEIEF